jgi:multidrug resistance protein
MRLDIIPVLRAHPTILLLSVSTALLTSGQGMVAPILPLYADALGVSTATVGLVISAFGLARLMTNMPTAILSERFGRRLPLVGGPLIAALGNALAGTADSLELLLVFRFISGVGSATFITGAVIYIGDISTPANRGRLMSIYQGSFALGISLGPALGGIIAEVLGLRAPFFVVGVLSLFSGIWAFFKVPESRPRVEDEQPASNIAAQTGTAVQTGQSNASSGTVKPQSKYSFLLSKSFIFIVMVFFVTFFTRGGAQFTLLPLKGAHDLGLSPGQLGAIFTIPPVIGFLLLPFAGSISDRYGRKKTIVPGLLIVAVSLLVLGTSSFLILFVIGMALYGLGNGIEGPTPVAYVADISPRARQGIAQGAARSIGDLAILIAPPAMGLAADLFGATKALVANGIIVGFLGLVFLAFAKESHVTRGDNRDAAAGGAEE